MGFDFSGSLPPGDPIVPASLILAAVLRRWIVASGGLGIAGEAQGLSEDGVISYMVHQDQDKPRVQRVAFRLGQAVMGGDEAGIAFIGLGEVRGGDEHRLSPFRGRGQGRR